MVLQTRSQRKASEKKGRKNAARPRGKLLKKEGRKNFQRRSQQSSMPQLSGKVMSQQMGMDPYGSEVQFWMDGAKVCIVNPALRAAQALLELSANK